MITVRLVTDLQDGKPVSELELLQPVVKTVFDEDGTRTIPVGERATLWARNANVDGKFPFETFFEGKYIYRKAELEIDPIQLGPGGHAINPGNHRFTLAPDGTLATDDPEIKIDNEKRIVSLKMHKVEVLAVDDAKTGPPDYRLIGAELGLLALQADTVLDPANLPGPRALPNMLSHTRKFYPLEIWLPSNAQGYVLYPSWQAFAVTPQGKVDLQPGKWPRVPGIEADGLRIVIPHRRFIGKINTTTGLAGGVGTAPLGGEMNFSPTLEAIRFTAGLGKPDESFFLSVDPDFSKTPNKFFLADNLGSTGAQADDPYAVRLLVMEWGHPVFARGSSVSISLRFLETPGKQTLKQPAARMAYSVYKPSSPDARFWHDLGQVSWSDGRLTFTAPDAPYDFYIFRATITDAFSLRSATRRRPRS